MFQPFFSSFSNIKIEIPVGEICKQIILIFDPALLIPILQEQGYCFPQNILKIPNNSYIDDPFNYISPFTPAIHTNLYQILSCPYEGAMKRMFLEAKALELIVLRLEQLLLKAIPTNTFSLKSVDKDSIHYAKEILLKNMSNPPSLLDLSKQTGINVNKLKYGFKELFGNTVFGYLRDQRLDIACLLLKTKKMSVTEVAHEVGYNNISSFAEAFKTRFGMNPSEYVKKDINFF